MRQVWGEQSYEEWINEGNDPLLDPYDREDEKPLEGDPDNLVDAIIDELEGYIY